MSAADLGLYTRPRLDEEPVRALLAEVIAADGEGVIDLGGTMSLNLHLVGQGLVLRVHPRFVEVERLAALQAIRAQVAGRGLLAAMACDVNGRPILRAGDYLVEVEEFVAHETRAATWDSYLWMFEGTGHLHRALADCPPPPIPEVATYGTPPLLIEELETTVSMLGSDHKALDIAGLVRRLIAELAAGWVAEDELPQQVIHGDVRLGNLALTPQGDTAFFDFGFAARRPRIHELAYALSWIILRPDDTGTAEAFDWDSFPELIAAYENGRGHQLLDRELQALPYYLASVPLYLAAISGHTPQPGLHLRNELPFIRIAEWVLANSGLVTEQARTKH